MSGDFNNPYRSPVGDSQDSFTLQQRVKGRVVAPAIALIVIAVLGLLFSLFGVFNALTAEPMVDPNAPPAFQEFMKNTVGPSAAIMQGVFIIVNMVIIAGAYFMSRVESWGMSLTATILAMINFGNCCCLLGIPIGIWSLVILLQPDVKAAFNAPLQR